LHFHHVGKKYRGPGLSREGASKKSWLVVAGRVRPVLVLPVGNHLILAKGIGPVVPLLAARGNVGLSVLLECALDDGKNEISKLIDGILPEHRVVNVAGHVGPPLLGTPRL